MTYCFLYATIFRSSTSPPPSRLRRQPPLARGAERFEQPCKQSKSCHKSAKSHYPHIIQFSTTKHKNRCRRSRQAITWRVPSDDRRVLHESPGVQGPKPLVLFSRLFQKSRALAGQATPGRAAALHRCVTVGVQTVRSVHIRPPLDVCGIPHGIPVPPARRAPSTKQKMRYHFYNSITKE